MQLCGSLIILWRRRWQPIPVFLPGESHGWRTLVGYSPWGHKESDTTEQLHFTFYHPLALPFFGTGIKTDLFQSCGHCWVFQICWHIMSAALSQHVTERCFRIWNSSTGIPSRPLALLVVMRPKAHLTSHSRMSGSRWVITPSWRSFLYSSVYSCHLFKDDIPSRMTQSYLILPNENQSLILKGLHSSPSMVLPYQIMPWRKLPFTKHWPY